MAECASSSATSGEESVRDYRDEGRYDREDVGSYVVKYSPVQKQARNTSDLKRKNDGPAAILSSWPRDLRNL